jgi:hypothetical protein
LRLDGLGSSIEDEVLTESVSGWSGIFEDEVVGTDAFNDSLHEHLGDDEEWSVDFQAEVFVQSLSLDLLGFVSVDELPLLRLGAVLLEGNNTVTFLILLGIKASVVLHVAEVVLAVPFEELPPS